MSRTDFRGGSLALSDIPFRLLAGLFLLKRSPVGHWMQSEVLDQRHDAMSERAKKNFDTARWQCETGANRISVAWWREHDPAYLAKLVNDFRAIEAKLPNPVPPSEAPKHFFTREYDRISSDPDIYGWFQLQMVILMYDEQPALSFQRKGLAPRRA